MANHKRKRTRNQRAGCKMCKYWKVNGHRTEREDGERFSDHRRRVVADEEIAAALSALPNLGEWVIPEGVADELARSGKSIVEAFEIVSRVAKLPLVTK